MREIEKLKTRQWLPLHLSGLRARYLFVRYGPGRAGVRDVPLDRGVRREPDGTRKAGNARAMRTDEILLGAVLVMLIASTYMGFAVKRSLYDNQKSFEALTEALTKEIGAMELAIINLDEEVTRLSHRVAELEGGSSDAARIRSQPHPLN